MSADALPQYREAIEVGLYTAPNGHVPASGSNPKCGAVPSTPMRDRKLRNYRKFCNAIKHRFRVTFDPMPQADRLATVEAAIAEGGAA